MAQTPAASLAATAAAAFASEPVAEAVSSEPDLASDFVLYETGWDYPDSLPPTSTHLQQLVNRGFYHQGAATAELLSMLSTLLGNWSWTADIAEQSITFAGQGNLLRTKFYALGSQSNISNTWRWVAKAEAGGLLDPLAREHRTAGVTTDRAPTARRGSHPCPSARTSAAALGAGRAALRRPALDAQTA